MIYLSALALMGMGLVSCSQEIDSEMAQFEKDQVHFSAQVSGTAAASTRHIAEAWEVGDQVAIMKGDIVKTYKTTNTTGTLTVADGIEPYKWDGTNYDLKAWSPMVTGIKNLKDQSTEKLFWDCDLMTSSATVGSKEVKLEFAHAMTRVWYQLQVFDGYTATEAQNATVTFYGYGEATFDNGELKSYGADNAVITPRTWINTANNNYKEGEALMVPGTVWEKPLIEVTIAGHTFRYTPKQATEADKETGVLKAGVVQQYFLKVDRKKMEVEVKIDSSIKAWQTVDKGRVEGEPVIPAA